MADEPFDKIYTADEAAERFRITKRALIKIAKRHGCCSRVGRDYFFSESDLLRLWEAIREPEPVRAYPIARAVQSSGGLEALRSLVDTGTNVDARLVQILRRLSEQTRPVTHESIERAGPKTIIELLRKGHVVKCGETPTGLPLVKITDQGRKQVVLFDKWKRHREERLRRGGRL